MVLTGGASPGESAPIPGAVRRFLQQDIYPFTSRLHLTPCPVVKIMDAALFYLSSSPSMVISIIFYTNTFAWHTDFIVLVKRNLTGAGNNKQNLHILKRKMLVSSSLCFNNSQRADCLFIHLTKNSILVDCAEV